MYNRWDRPESPVPTYHEIKRPSRIAQALWILATLMSALALLLFYQADHVDRLPKLITIRSNVSQAEILLNQMALLRDKYLVCGEKKEAAGCGVKISAFEAVVRQFQGIEPENFSFDRASLRIRGFLRYTGTDVSVSPVFVDISLPSDLLTASRSACPPAKPFLIGLDAEGKALCRAISAKECGEGQYVSSIDPLTLAPICSNAGKEISCGPGDMLAGFEWQGEDRVVSACRPRLNPFIAWGFKPNLRRGPALNDGDQ